MIVRRLLSAVALTAGLALPAWSQTPPVVPPPTPPPAVTPPVTPTAPVSNPDLEKGVEALKKQPPDIEACLKHFKDACDKDKKLAPPKVILAEIYFQTNNPQAGRFYLEQAGVEDPDHPDPFILSARIAAGDNRIMEAMIGFETALTKASLPRWLSDQRPRWIRICREGLAQSYSRRNNPFAAIDQLKAILDDEKKNAVIRLQLAQILFLTRQDELAFKELEQAHADDPKSPQIGLPEANMGQMWDNRPVKEKADADVNRTKAEEWFKKGLAKHAGDVRAPREYGRWLLAQARIAEADTQLDAAAKLDPKDNEARALTGLSHRYKKQYKQAEDIFAALNLDQINNLIYALNLALCETESNDVTIRHRAVQRVEFISRGQARSAEVFAVLAWCYFKDDRLDDAEGAMNNSAKLHGNSPAQPDTLYYFARILDKKGKGVEARNALKPAIDSRGAFVNRKDAEAFYKELVAKHGEPKAEEKKDDKKAEEKKP